MIKMRKATAADVPVILRFLTAMAAEAGESIGSTEASLLAHGFGPAPRFSGLFAEQDPEPGLVAAELRRSIADLPAGLRDDDETLRESLRAALRKALGRRFRKRPNVEIHVIRV